MKSGTKLKRVQTGIEGLDKLMQGGLPLNSSTLITGGPGTGKTILAMQYIVNGAAKYNENGLYVSFEQRANALKQQAKQFGWNIDALEKKGKIKLLCISSKDINAEIIDDIVSIIKRHKIKRLVIDSLSTLTINAPIYSKISEMAVKDVIGENTILYPPVIGENIVSKFIYAFIDSLGDLESCTTLLIAESAEERVSQRFIGAYVCDGVIELTFEALGGEFSRSLLIRKMRQTKSDEDIHPLEIISKGIKVHDVVK